MLRQCMKLFCQLLALFAAGTAAAGAEPVNNVELLAFKPLASCSIAKAADHDDRPVYFFHHRFSEGTQDLAIVKPLSGTDSGIKRVTFENSDASGCLSRYLAIARGGNWGWHLLWQPQHTTVLRYARMDGEAWVSSPVKTLAKQVQAIGAPDIFTSGLQVWVVWVEASAGAYRVFSAYSEDEGRSWQDAGLIGQLDHEPGRLRLVEKEQVPYLEGQGFSMVLPGAGKP